MSQRPLFARLRPWALALVCCLLLRAGWALLPAGAAESLLSRAALASALGSRSGQALQLWRQQRLASADVHDAPPPSQSVSKSVEEAAPSLPEEALPPEEDAVLEAPAPVEADDPAPEEEPPPADGGEDEALDEDSREAMAQAIRAIPQEFRGSIIEEDLSAPGKAYPAWGLAKVKNLSSLGDEELLDLLQEPYTVEDSVPGPQVLIYHTHTTESYEPWDSAIYDKRHTWRSTDEDENMVAVGEALREALEAAGLTVLHDKTLHDYPSYSGSYERSAETVSAILAENPSIRFCIDVHRDAVQQGSTLLKPVTEQEGEKCAQLMILCGHDDGSLNIPAWRQNLRLAVRLQDAVESRYPGLCRPITLMDRRYNQHLSSGSLLFEVGSHGNTLEEACRCAQLCGEAMGPCLLQLLALEEQ